MAPAAERRAPAGDPRPPPAVGRGAPTPPPAPPAPQKAPPRADPADGSDSDGTLGADEPSPADCTAPKFTPRRWASPPKAPAFRTPVPDRIAKRDAASAALVAALLRTGARDEDCELAEEDIEEVPRVPAGCARYWESGLCDDDLREGAEHWEERCAGDAWRTGACI